MYSFIDELIAGNALLEDIDDFVDKWHEQDTGMRLHEYLGLTEEEYQVWLLNPDIIPIVLKARIEDRNSLEMIGTEVYAMAARSTNPSTFSHLQKWLTEKGYIGHD